MADVEMNNRVWSHKTQHFFETHSRFIIVVLVLLSLAILGSVASPYFRSSRNLLNFGRKMVVVLTMLSIGQTMVMIAGGIDLSVGAMVKLIGVFSAGMMLGEQGRLIPVSLLCLGFGGLVGLVNGLIVTKARVAPFIATLGMMSILRGIAFGYTTTPIGSVPKSMRFLARGMVGPFPFALFVIILFIVVACFVLKYTRFGRHLYAVGGNDEIARLTGINVDRTRILTYVVSGGLAALAGLFMVSRMGVGEPDIGEGLELDSITAVILGGTSLAGGVGGILGTVAGVLILGLIDNILNLLRVSSFYQLVVKGIIILIAVSIHRAKRQ
ncbi:MAG: ABC transporter permease [Desulfobacterales bacterium]|nr:MAG: ABC transporter permease [Desulfobacterales bacterium]